MVLQSFCELLNLLFHRCADVEDRVAYIKSLLQEQVLPDTGEPLFDREVFEFRCANNKEMENRVFNNWREKLHTCRYRDTPIILSPMSRKSKLAEVLEMTHDISMIFLDIIVESIKLNGTIVHEDVKKRFIAAVEEAPSHFFTVARTSESGTEEDYANQNRLVSRSVLLTKLQSLSADVWAKAVSLIAEQDYASHLISTARMQYDLSQPKKTGSALFNVVRVEEENASEDQIAAAALDREQVADEDRAKVMCILQ